MPVTVTAEALWSVKINPDSLSAPRLFTLRVVMESAHAAPVPCGRCRERRVKVWSPTSSRLSPLTDGIGISVTGDSQAVRAVRGPPTHAPAMTACEAFSIKDGIYAGSMEVTPQLDQPAPFPRLPE